MKDNEQRYTEYQSNTKKEHKKNKSLRTFIAGLALAGSLQAAPLNQHTVRFERPTTSISATVDSNESNNLFPQNGVIFKFEKEKKEREHAFSSEQLSEKLHQNAKEKLSPASTTREYINFFKAFHKEEGLPEDWQTLQYGDTQVGFSIKKQMDLLSDDTPESREKWAMQTYRDLQGYLLEYISPYNVFPWQHEVRITPNGEAHLVDARYGGRLMIDTVTDEERGGSVKSVLEVIDQAVVSGKVSDGSMFLQISPQDASETGLTQDNGAPIVYKDTHLMFSQVKNNKLEGFTVKTDFTKAECRELIKRVTGKTLPADAPIEDYIRAFAFIDPSNSKFKSIDDLVGVAADVRSELSFKSKNAYKDKSWKDVLEQIGLGDKLYEWTETSQAILRQYVQDIIHDNPKQEELPEYIAATILRAVHAAEVDQLTKVAEGITIQHLHNLKVPSISFGKILQDTAAKPGCAGGGAETSGSRFGKNSTAQIGGANAELCPKISCGCGWVASDSEVASIQSGTLTHCPECDSLPGEGAPEKKKQKAEPAVPNSKGESILAA